MDLYPLKPRPIYKEKIWGGRSLQRLFNRPLPAGKDIGESWELADLPEGASVISNGPLAGKTLTLLTRQLGAALLGKTAPQPDGRFPLLLKLLDANDTLSLQVHPDERAVDEIGPTASLKTECWYIVESRNGYICKGVKDGVTPAQFRRAVQQDTVGDLVRRIEVKTGDFHYLPAGTVHALGSGVVVAEVQTPSDTTYRVTDWGRGREIHVDLSMQCIRFDQSGDNPPGAGGECLLKTNYFEVARRSAPAGQLAPLAAGRCAALMILTGRGAVTHAGPAEPMVSFVAGDTILVPAGARSPAVAAADGCTWLETTLPEK